MSMNPYPLAHSWPLFERDQRFDLGRVFDWDDAPASDLAIDAAALAAQGIGVWDCDLSDGSLTWSAAVYDLFGLPQGRRVPRVIPVSLYAEPSRAAMERLRAYAIKHRRGFTLDVEILPANGGHRWLRLAAAPLCVDRKPVRLRGFKRDVSHDYS
ncbi:hypothetical protein GCM10009087_03130 [Sphingomonas oligophenolica]